MRSANKLFMTQLSMSGVSLKGGKKCVWRGAGEGHSLQDDGDCFQVHDSKK